MCPGYHSEGQACIRPRLQALIWGSGYHFRIVLHLTSLSESLALGPLSGYKREQARSTTTSSKSRPLPGSRFLRL